MREVERAGGPRKGSFLPSDYCYNKINAGPTASQWLLFVEHGRGLYKYVGHGYPYTGPVMWKPADGAERKVGVWHDGVRTLDFDPREHAISARARLVNTRF
jgi:hypothetical protein